MPSVLNFGSLNIDKVYQVAHMVREGETISSQSLNVFPGGKGLNQSVALAHARASVYQAGGIGEDGRWLVDILTQAGVNCRFVEERTQATGHAIIQVDATGKNCILLHAGANEGNTDAFIEQVLAEFGTGDMLLLQNEINGLTHIIEVARERDLTIVLNPSPFDERIEQLPLDQIDYFLVNEHEAAYLAEFLGVDADTTAELSETQLLEVLHGHLAHALIVMTVGERGVYAITPEGTQSFQEPYRTQAVDTTGAGDCFTGFFLATYAETQDLAYALKVASRAASISVSRAGAATSIPQYEEVIQALAGEVG